MLWFLRLFFKLLYHSFAWSYDLVAAIVSGGRWKEWVRSVIPLLQGQDILELGIGTGILQTALMPSEFNVYGLDESRQMLRIAKNRIRGQDSSRKLLRADAKSIPLAPRCIDTIVATFPSDYIMQPDTLLSCRRVLRPGGQMVILLGVEVGGISLQSRLLRIFYRVTGQGTPDYRMLENNLSGLAQFGFTAKIHQIQVQQDILTVVIAV